MAEMGEMDKLGPRKPTVDLVEAVELDSFPVVEVDTPEVTPMVIGLILVEPTVEAPIMRGATKAIPVETTVDTAT